MRPDGPRVVAIGGGHGLALSLRAAERYAGQLIAIVATSDDGGSSGRLRQTTGMPAPGDLRRCLSAMAVDRVAAAAFEHRFTDGDLAGHAVGNIVLAGLVETGLDLDAAARHVSSWLQIDAQRAAVMPVTAKSVELVAHTSHGLVRGQVAVKDTPDIVQVCLDPPEPDVAPGVLEAIAAADQILIGPGSLYTSVLAAVAIPAVRMAVTAARAQVVFVCNLQSNEAEAKDYTVADHIDALLRHGVHPDVVVAQRGALPMGETGSQRVVVADVDRPHGLAHDADLLATVLERFV